MNEGTSFAGTWISGRKYGATRSDHDFLVPLTSRRFVLCLAMRQTQFYGGVYTPAANRGAAHFPRWFGELRQGRFSAHLEVSMVS